MNHRTRILAVFLLVATGCGRPDAQDPSGLSVEKFTDVYVALRVAQRNTTTPEQFQEKKKQILAQAGVSEVALQHFADAHKHDVSLMATIWDTIQHRLDRADTLARQ
jgi:hypothetical protein